MLRYIIICNTVIVVNMIIPSFYDLDNISSAGNLSVASSDSSDVLFSRPSLHTHSLMAAVRKLCTGVLGDMLML